MIYLLMSKKKTKKTINRLANLLGANRVITSVDTSLIGEVIINWGYHKGDAAGYVINNPESVRVSRDKLETFRRLNGVVPIPEYTEYYEFALDWIRDGYKVFARTLLKSHSGKGIVIATKPEELVYAAPLYTKAFNTTKEYRVHVCFDKIIDVVQKKKKTAEKLEEERIEFNPLVRSHKNGWVFARKNVKVNEDILISAITSIDTLGLDFGAVDIAFNEKTNEHVVLEVNSCPGMKDKNTFEAYLRAFEGYLWN